MDSDQDARFQRLSPRQRECLRLVYHRKKSGQIATALGLSTGTVHGYCTEAVRTLGARDRVDAAEQFVAWERSGACGPQKAGETSPLGIGVESAGVVPAGTSPAVGGIGPAASWWRRLAPIRFEGNYDNDLGVLARILWIPLLALVLAVGFAAVADTLRVASQLVAGGGSR